MKKQDRKQLAILAMQNHNLNADVINNLNADVINNLNAYVIKNLDADVINNLNADVLALFNSKIEEWDSIPVLEKPYNRLINDIKEKKRIHKQSTWGEIEFFDPEANVCGTPMCTAGHLVNMAGKIGYELKDRYGWEIAGLLIHKKTHPDLPCQNFGDRPQDWALAYIEEMAEEENKA